MNGEWRELWQDYGPKLLLFARQQTPEPGEAEDIVQEAFVRYWKSQAKDAQLPPALMFTFVKRIAIDCARKRENRRSRESEARAWSEQDCSLFENRLEDRERTAFLEDSLKALPDPQREVLVLKIWGELTFDEIGRTLEISPHTAASRYRYALNQLKTLLNPSLI